MLPIDIGALSRSSGVPASTLRYYEQIGLIQACARHGLRRQYGQETVGQLALISLGKAAGFSLREIGGMLGEGGTANLSRPTLHERVDALDRQISRLSMLRDTLRRVAACPAPTHMQCPRFQALLRLVQRAGPAQTPDHDRRRRKKSGQP